MAQANWEQMDAQVNAAEARLRKSQAQLEQTRAQVEVTRGVVKQAETSFRYTTILSPIDGTAVARNITVGQSVAASLQAPNVFTIAQDLKRMQVYAKTDESDARQIKTGTGVTFQVDAFPTEVFRGRVSAIRLNAYTVQNVVTYDTIIDFENTEEKLLPGETAYVTIPTGQARRLRIAAAARGAVDVGATATGERGSAGSQFSKTMKGPLNLMKSGQTLFRIPVVFLMFLPILSLMPLLRAEQMAQRGTTTREDFFIISSMDAKKRQIVLKRPTEVTELVRVTEKTVYLDEQGKAIDFKSLRAGDTVYITSSPSPDGVRIATEIRRGPMTREELHHRYVLFQ